MAHLAVTQSWLPTDRRLRAAVAGLLPGAPIVIMLHGYKYDPRRAAQNPQRHIFSLHPDKACKRPASWPRRLALRGDKGLAIGFGWHACGTIWQAHRNADRAGARLAQLIERLNRLYPERPVHIVAHSLGARVALSAMTSLHGNAIRRVILIAAAVFEHELLAALKSDAGRKAELINIRSKANTVFDLMLRVALPHWGKTAGRGGLVHPNLLDINIDCTRTQAALTEAGFAMSAAGSRICHWSGYLRDDVCALYRRLLHRPDTTPIPFLRSITRPEQKSLQAAIKGHLSF